MNRQLNCKAIVLLSLLIGSSSIYGQANKTKTSQGINVSDMDQKVKPNDDFYRYVNGAWLDKTEIPSDKTSYGSSYILYEKTEKDALNILKDAVKNPKYKADSDQGKTVTFYKSIIDTVSRNAQGITPIKKYLDKINSPYKAVIAFSGEIDGQTEAKLNGFSSSSIPKEFEKIEERLKNGYFVFEFSI